MSTPSLSSASWRIWASLGFSASTIWYPSLQDVCRFMFETSMFLHQDGGLMSSTCLWMVRSVLVRAGRVRCQSEQFQDGYLARISEISVVPVRWRASWRTLTLCHFQPLFGEFQRVLWVDLCQGEWARICHLDCWSCIWQCRKRCSLQEGGRTGLKDWMSNFFLGPGKPPPPPPTFLIYNIFYMFIFPRINDIKINKTPYMEGANHAIMPSEVLSGTTMTTSPLTTIAWLMAFWQILMFPFEQDWFCCGGQGCSIIMDEPSCARNVGSDVQAMPGPKAMAWAWLERTQACQKSKLG